MIFLIKKFLKLNQKFKKLKMKKTYEMLNSPEFPKYESKIKSPELHHNYLEEENLLPQINSNFNVNILI